MSEINCNNCAISDFKESLCKRCDEMKRLGRAEDIEKLIIECLPSAQPTHDCDTCRYRNLEWDEEPCDSCTAGGENNHWKPSAQPEPLTDKEQRIFLAAMGREEKVCKQVDEECRDCREPYEDSLVRTCHEIIRKVKGALWI